MLWVGIIGAAAFPFALAMSFALLAIWALQQGRRGRFAVGAVLTLAASPLGFVLLTVVSPGSPSRAAACATSRVQIAVVVGCAAGELLVYRLFGDGGRFPFETLQLLPGLVLLRDRAAA